MDPEAKVGSEQCEHGACVKSRRSRPGPEGFQTTDLELRECPMPECQEGEARHWRLKLFEAETPCKSGAEVL